MADGDEQLVLDVEGGVQLRDAQLRELDIRIMPWDTPIVHEYGPEMFTRGAFADVDPRKVVLKAPDANGKHTGPVTGRGMAIHDRDDGAYMTFKVAKTQAGDDQLALAADQVITGASVGFLEVPNGSSVQRRDGKRIRVHTRAALDHVVTTWRPAYQGAGVVAMRSRAEGDGPMAESQEAVAAATEPAVPAISVDLSTIEKAFSTFADKMDERVAKIEERNRADFTVPSGEDEPHKPKLYEWGHIAIRQLAGEQISTRELQERALLDVTTSDVPGAVPDAFSADVIGLIDPARPFLRTTRQIPVPQSGMTITVPVLGVRATVDVQANEKDDIDSTTPTVTTTSFNAISIFGGADVSIQLIRRSDPAFMDLLLQELGEAYALKSDEEAVGALLSAGVTPGTGTLDPETLTIGEAWGNSINNYKRAPDHIWLSSDAVTLFIDAKANGTNQSLYGGLGGAFSVAGGTGDRISGLIPVYVPALDGTGTDVVIGPSAGFAWAEDGTFQLSADNPGKAGRDIALGGILFLMPRYPAAFTTYAV